MDVLRVILTVAFIFVCMALVVLVLMQEGKSAGLGAISGAAETYWGKNKGRSMEGRLVKIGGHRQGSGGAFHDTCDGTESECILTVREGDTLVEQQGCLFVSADSAQGRVRL